MSSKTKGGDTVARAEYSVLQGIRTRGFEDDDDCITCVEDGGDKEIITPRQGFVDSSASLDSNDVGGSETQTNGNVRSSRYKVPQIGIWYTLTSAVIMALSGMIVIHISGTLGPNQMVFSRMTIQLLCCLPVNAYRRVPFKHSRNAYLLLLLRSILGATNISLIVITYQIMPVSSSKSIEYSAPVFAGLLGWLLLRESCSFVDTLLSFLTLSGVLLIAQPSFLFANAESVEGASDDMVLGSTLSLISAILSASIFIIMRKLGSYNMPSLTMLTFFSIYGACFSIFLTSICQQWSLPGCGWDRMILLSDGIAHFSSQILIYLALQTERASTVALVHSSDILFSFTLEYLFFGVIPNYLTVIGAFLIIASFVGITLKKWREN
ncbi:solute carrier family 35 member G1-like [Strongylocentrotus purpuratus]|uniref:EamA domain-containing protein n=1 Tax=Strongylocentrotus purpuratus TaxID=7668 RepID=A0A7M7GJD1_STRPU|nr:solute carrier family 35 member G1-like [Strongylocentrotus purpuratus]